MNTHNFFVPRKNEKNNTTNRETWKRHHMSSPTHVMYQKTLVFNPSPPLFLQAPPTKTNRLTQDKTISTTSCSTECKCHPRGHKMFKLLSYTFLTVLTGKYSPSNSKSKILISTLPVDLLATSGDLAITWTSPVLAKLYSNDSAVNPFDQPITEDEDSWIGSLINIGAMIGPFPYGFLADKYGRKIGLLAVSVPYIVSYLTLAFSKTVYLYYFARLLGGIAIGGGYTLLPMYVAEIAEDSNRGNAVSKSECLLDIREFDPVRHQPIHFHRLVQRHSSLHSGGVFCVVFHNSTRISVLSGRKEQYHWCREVADEAAIAE
jgi:hypothetical protein